jgi:multidrug transporter EmrE-like cation transporter
MSVTYNESAKVIEIKDGLKTHLFLMKFVMIVTLTNALLNISNAQIPFGFMKALWLVLGMISVVVLHKYIFKKSGSEKIPIDQIKGLSESVFLGRKKYFMALQNGKQRDLLAIKSDAEFTQVRKLFSKNGLPT